MDRIRMTAPRQTIEDVNVRLGEYLQCARGALRGESVFIVEEVRQLRELLRQMELLVPQFSDLRRQEPELGEALDGYKMRLGELAVALRAIRVMLLAQRSQMDAQRAQFAAVRQWAGAARQTCGPEMR